MSQQCALPGWTNAGNFLQPGLADVALAPLPVRADREAMRLVAQALNEIEHRIARRQLERRAARHEEGLAAGVAVRSLGDSDDREIVDAECRHGLAGGCELPLAAIDQQQIGPRGLSFVAGCWSMRRILGRFPPPLWGRDGEWGHREFSGHVAEPLARRFRGRLNKWFPFRNARRLRDQPLEPPLQHLTHHGVVVARSDIRADVELAILVLAEALRAGNDHG